MKGTIRLGVKTAVFCAALLCAASAVAQEAPGMNAEIRWDLMEIRAKVSLDLAGSGLGMPSGRTRGEALLASEYLRLMRQALMKIQVDSSTTLADMVQRGDWGHSALDAISMQATSVPPSLSPSLDSLSSVYTLGMPAVSSAIISHRRAADIPRTLSPVSAPEYTGIVIMAFDPQRIHGMEGSSQVVPALFPRIWDSEMNLIFERNMVDPSVASMARYFSRDAIFARTPSGLSPEALAVVGERPLRIFARGVFGQTPTDPVISREDALQIISSPENRNLLRNGKVAIILDTPALSDSFGVN
jgi:hypothetical protein